jgi:hypothetical protein
MALQILAVSDVVDQRIYSTSLSQRMPDIDIVIGCGDVPATYLEFLTDSLRRPVYYVLGNHAEELTRSGERGHPRLPEGCIDLGGKVVTDPVHGLIMAGLPGSPRYSEQEPIQFTERQMLWMIARMAPRLIWNKFRHGRALDLLVTHSPPRGFNDRSDTAHQGFTSMLRFLSWFQPKYQVHGHIHIYDRSQPTTVDFLETEIINVYPYLQVDLHFDHVSSPERSPRDDSDPFDNASTIGLESRP